MAQWCEVEQSKMHMFKALAEDSTETKHESVAPISNHWNIYQYEDSKKFNIRNIAMNSF